MLLSVLLTAVLMIPVSLPVSAANKRFISELRIAAGEDAVAALEEDGWSVTMVGLNLTTEAASQVYLAYKLNTGTPLTNVIVSPDVGETYTDKNGIVYKCMSHVDVDEGLGGKAGCVYATTDKRAGSPLVGIDVLRSNSEEGSVLYPITNDGAEIVRTPTGTPADLEAASETDVVYLAQIRDGIVRPYIREIGVVTDTDKWNAVYTACERGYNYYVDGDLDDSTDTYTLICYERTADPSEAVTGITAVTADTVAALEQGQIVDSVSAKSEQVTAAAVSISGLEYVRIASKPVSAKEPYYIYRTKDTKAGNPISMLYVETAEETQNFLFGTWANEYFFSKGVTTAYSYSMNEDIYNTLWEDQTVCTKLPVRLLNSFSGSNTASDNSFVEPSPYVSEPEASENSPTASQEASTVSTVSETTSQEASKESTVSETVSEASTQQLSNEVSAFAQEVAQSQEPSDSSYTDSGDTVKYINLTILTPRDGLPDTAVSLTGMRGDPFNPYIEQTERSDRTNKFQASVFASPQVLTPILGGVVILVAVGFIFFKRRSAKKAALAGAEQSGNPKKAQTSKKSKKSKKSR